MAKMASIVDTNVLIDALRGNRHAWELISTSRRAGAVHASEVTRVELLTGMRRSEEQSTRQLLDLFTWHPVDEGVATVAGELGRHWQSRNSGIDLADFVVAATAIRLRADLKTRNTKHFPMFEDLTPPY